MNHPLRDWLEYAGLSAAAWLVRQLDFSTLRPIANFIGSLVYFLDPRGRRTALQNLESAFPSKFSPAEKRRIARGSYCSFARTMLELFWAPNITEKFVRDHVVFEGWEHDTCRANPEKSAIYCCMHFSNFEWLGLVGAYSITRGPVIAQKFKNKFLGPIFNELRASTGNTVIPQERAMIKMLKHLKSGGKFGMLIDLNIDPREGSVPIETFGGLMNVIIPRNTTIPCKAGEMFTNAVANQASMRVTVLQGEREMARDNWPLGSMEVAFPPAPKGQARVGVQFELDANGILHVLARDTATGRDSLLDIQSAVEVSDEAVEKMLGIVEHRPTGLGLEEGHRIGDDLAVCASGSKRDGMIPARLEAIGSDGNREAVFRSLFHVPTDTCRAIGVLDGDRRIRSAVGTGFVEQRDFIIAVLGDRQGVNRR
jgi:hypothetical protein